ncbi:hypothetical protein [Pseudonocardia humida]|uniref:Dynamin family protein n=1 Tax=Pseudonocardia humida TaxID=2800819 RepID=A0ABT1AAP6_9PSEU|nr:hypothetical protein [Pseudonocardia humida]MCO1660117.1 hypothetical protein [Pseudonocardia humida]
MPDAPTALEPVPPDGDLPARISAILDRRHALVAPVRAELEWWQRVDAQLTALAAAVAVLRDHPSTSAELRAELAAFGLDGRVDDARSGVAEATRLLRVLSARFARGTITVGVSGKARVGKSTLLQSISGLDDEQIPTGKGLPVTAVRSRIRHSETAERATLSLHTFETFAADVLAPHHAQLGLPGLPTSLEEFARWRYPAPSAPGEQSGDPAAPPSHATLLKRLRDMQAALPSYAGDLVGGERELHLDELRPYVAYPTNAELGDASGVSRRYLAVRDLRIETRFPHNRVQRLAVVDLPGLGEVAVGADAHHVEGLQNEVDVVLLVKRAMGDEAYWGEADARALDLLDIARGFVAKRDFVVLVLNQGGVEEAMATTLRDDVTREVNMGEPDRFFQVVETDAADPADVHRRVLAPVLDHLAARLPAMDAEVLAATRAQTQAVVDRIDVLVGDLSRALATVRAATGSAAEDLDRRARRLRQDVAAGLQELVARLREQARDAAEDPEYVATVERAYLATREWITGGLGVGEEAWRDEGLRRMRVDSFSGGYAGEELNRVRVEISDSFERIDGFFTERVEKLWTDVARVLGTELGTLLGDPETDVGEGGTGTGHDALDRFADLLDAAQPPCPRLRRAVRTLRGIRLDYRSQLHPRVRSELDGLALELPDPQTGQLRTQITVAATAAGAEELYRFVLRMAEQAAYLTQKALLREAVTPALVLHAAAEQFEDTVIRSGESEVEFRRLADAYKNDIWPGVYREMDAANARFTAVTRARDLLVATLGARKEDMP